MENKVKLKKERTFTEVFNAANELIRQEYKLLLRVLFVYAFPVLLLSSLASSYYGASLGSFLPADLTQFHPGDVINNQFWLTLALSLFGMAVLYTVLYAALSLYASDRPDAFNQDRIQQTLLKHLGPITILIVISLLPIIAGMFLFVIPGIYLGVAMSFIFIIQVQENATPVASIKRSFQLIRGHWWPTFGLIIASGIMVLFAGLILSLPQSIYLGIKGLSSLNSGEIATQDSLFLFIVVLTSSLSTLLYAYPMLVVGVQYFSLVQKHDQPDLRRRIDQLYGNTSARDDE